MERPPLIELFVTQGCASCARAERALRGCGRLDALVSIAVREIGAPGVEAPPGVIGGPTTVFRGIVVALGTPDCEKLAARVRAMLQDGLQDAF